MVLLRAFLWAVFLGLTIFLSSGVSATAPIAPNGHVGNIETSISSAKPKTPIAPVVKPHPKVTPKAPVAPEWVRPTKPLTTAPSTKQPLKAPTTSSAAARLQLNNQGWILNALVNPRSTLQEMDWRKGDWKGIIVHQTMDNRVVTADTLLTWWNKPECEAATHFLIGRNGIIYQAASLNTLTWHSGSLRPRCKHPETDPVSKKSTASNKLCNYPDYKGDETKSAARKAISDAEKQSKQVPERYPSNYDSIGIELIAARGATDDLPPQPVTAAQNAALKWLIASLIRTYPTIKTSEVWRHPVIAYKNKFEASTAKW